MVLVSWPLLHNILGGVHAESVCVCVWEPIQPDVYEADSSRRNAGRSLGVDTQQKRMRKVTNHFIAKEFWNCMSHFACVIVCAVFHTWSQEGVVIVVA